MASVAMMVGGAIVNALAFSGSNYLFSKLDQKGLGDTLEEQKRHDKAMEKLQTAQADWSERRTEHLDKKLMEQNQAVQYFRDANAAWREYTRLTGETLDPLEPEP